jgi:hypothetical protein
MSAKIRQLPRSAAAGRLRSAAASSALILLSVFAATATAQGTEQPAAAAPPGELERLKAELELEKTRRDIAQAERDAFKAQVEQARALSDAQGADGSVEFKDAGGYFATLQSYSSLNSAAVSVGSRIQDAWPELPIPDACTKVRPILAVGSKDDLVNTSVSWRFLDARFGLLEDAISTVSERYPDQGKAVPGDGESAAVLATLPAVLGLATEVAAFFKTDVEITGRKVEKDPAAFRASLAGVMTTLDLKWANAPTLKPEIVVPGFGAGKSQDGAYGRLGELTEKIRELRVLRNNLANAYAEAIAEEALNVQIEQVRVETLTAKLKKAIEQGKSTDTLETSLANARLNLDNARRFAGEWEVAKVSIDGLIVEAETFIKAVTTVAANGQSPISVAAQAEGFMKNEGACTYFLYADVASQGADIEVAKSAWSQGRVTYIGGAVVTYVLALTDGTNLASGIVMSHETAGFRRSSKDTTGLSLKNP